MPMDGLMVRTIAKKLNDNLSNAKLTKINELSSQVYALSFWKQGTPSTLMISLSANQAYIYLDNRVGTIEDVYNKHVILKLQKEFEENYGEYITERDISDEYKV